ncbi:tetratricopeptide repeat protein [Sessilibacter sp. MAH2]|mgnify:CR=1 FL=1
MPYELLKSLAYRKVGKRELIAVTLSCVLTGCVATQPTATAPVIPGQTQENSSSAPTNKAPAPTQAPSQQLALLNSKLYQANQALDQGKPEKAIEIAEQSLRLDRSDARFYLILSEAHWVMGNYDLARNFARQGLRYVRPSQTDIKQKLHKFTQI